MGKAALKQKISTVQNGKCVLSNDLLSELPELVDTDRIIPKAEGGTYSDENTRVVNPIAHMARHGNLRLRDEDLKELKAMIDDREQVMKLRNKVANQLRACKRRTDDLLTDTLEFLEQNLVTTDKVLKDRTKRIEKWVKKHKNKDKLIESALGVQSVGEKTIAYCLAYIDLEKADHASSLWAYAGLDKSSQNRYSKGTSGGGNKSLRCALWNMAQSQVKGRGAYREIYDRTKERLSISENMVDSRNTQGKLVNVAWKDTKPCHRDGAALRAIMKHFLADYWYVGRTLAGLRTDPLYVQEKLGHTGIIKPTERGWKLNYN